MGVEIGLERLRSGRATACSGRSWRGVGARKAEYGMTTIAKCGKAKMTAIDGSERVQCYEVTWGRRAMWALLEGASAGASVR